MNRRLVLLAGLGLLTGCATAPTVVTPSGASAPTHPELEAVYSAVAGRDAAPGALRRFRFVRRAAARRIARSALAFCSRVCSTTGAAGTASLGGVSMLCSRPRAKFLIKHAFLAWPSRNLWLYGRFLSDPPP